MRAFCPTKNGYDVLWKSVNQNGNSTREASSLRATKRRICAYGLLLLGFSLFPRKIENRQRVFERERVRKTRRSNITILFKTVNSWKLLENPRLSEGASRDALEASRAFDSSCTDTVSRNILFIRTTRTYTSPFIKSKHLFSERFFATIKRGNLQFWHKSKLQETMRGARSVSLNFNEKLNHIGLPINQFSLIWKGSSLFWSNEPRRCNFLRPCN